MPNNLNELKGKIIIIIIIIIMIFVRVICSIF